MAGCTNFPPVHFAVCDGYNIQEFEGI